MAQERKLAAIMFTDIVGYTSLMGESEKKTFEILNTNRLIHQKHVEGHHGRIVKELGDGLLTVFETGTEAVLCAVEIQKEAKEKDIPLRIGIHEGEVVVENEDVFGDGVNIASRIQAEAAPGGVCLSDSVYRIVRNKESLQVGKIGRVSLKNVRESLVLYQVISDDLSIRPVKKFFKQSWGFFLLIGIAGILVGVFSTQLYFTRNNPIQVKHLAMNFPDHAPLDKTMYRSIHNSFAISPDGKYLVYVGKIANSTNLYKRALNADIYEIIPGTENAQNPFFSPDGKWIGYYTENALRKIQLTGGQSTVLCYVKESTTCTWLPNDSIIFGGNQMEGLKIIHSSGGAERVLTQLNLENEELMHSYPFYIPGADKVLYSISSISEYISVNSLDLKTGKAKMLVKNAANPKYTPEGYLTYDFRGSLIANKYDPAEDLLSDDPVIVIDNTKKSTSFYGIQYDFSGDGTLLYMVYQAIMNGELVEVDMKGNIKVLITEDNSWIVGPKYSPDGKNIAFWMSKEEGSNVWIYNPARDHLTRFTSEGTNAWPIWTPDGWNIAFPSIRESSRDLNMYIKPFGSTQASEILIKTDKTQQPKAWTSDGRILLYHQQEESIKGWGIYILNMDNMQSKPFLNGDYDERKPDFSPDDQWVVYESSETGDFEIYVTDFPGKTVKHQVSVSGGYEPMWSPYGDRIFYRKGNDFYVVHVGMEPGINFSKPEVLFSGNYRYIDGWGRNYDMSPDEKHIVSVRDVFADTTRASINVVTNFFEEIRQKDGGK